MNPHDDYLWSKAGQGEDDLLRLERLLAPYAHPRGQWHEATVIAPMSAPAPTRHRLAGAFHFVAQHRRREG